VAFLGALGPSLPTDLVDLAQVNHGMTLFDATLFQ